MFPFDISLATVAISYLLRMLMTLVVDAILYLLRLHFEMRLSKNENLHAHNFAISDLHFQRYKFMTTAFDLIFILMLLPKHVVADLIFYIYLIACIYVLKVLTTQFLLINTLLWLYSLDQDSLSEHLLNFKRKTTFEFDSTTRLLMKNVNFP